MMGAGSSGVQKIQEQGRKVQKSLAPSPNAGLQKPHDVMMLLTFWYG